MDSLSFDYIVGENKPIGIDITRYDNASFTPTVTVTIADAAGSILVNASPCTVTSGVTAQALYQFAPNKPEVLSVEFTTTTAGSSYISRGVITVVA
jgi:hypothetical protein